MDMNHASTYVVPPVFNGSIVINMPPRFDQLILKKSTYEVSILKNFLKSCLALVKIENALA